MRESGSSAASHRFGRRPDATEVAGKGLWTSGVHVVQSNHAADTARLISTYYEAELALSLETATLSLKRRVATARMRRLQRTLARAEALAAELRGADPDADAALAARRSELQEARILTPDAATRLPEIEVLARDAQAASVDARQVADEEASVRSRMIEAAPSASRSTTPAALRALGGRLARTEAGVDAAQRWLKVCESRVNEDRGPESSEVTSEVELAQMERMASAARSRARRLNLGAVLLLALVAPVAMAIRGGDLSPVVGGLLFLALLPPTIELLLRSHRTRRLARSRVDALELRTEMARLDVVSRKESVRAEEREARRSVVRANEDLLNVRVEGRSLLGSDELLEPDRLRELADLLEEVTTLSEKSADLAARATNRLEALRVAVGDVGLITGDDVMAAVGRLRRLVPLRAVADDLYLDAVDAERRQHLREALHAVLGGRSLEAVRRAARSAAPGDNRPLLLIDDGDQSDRTSVVRMLAEIGDEALVVIVTDVPTAWPVSESDPTADRPDGSVAATEAWDRHGPAADEPVDPEPAVERPWFSSS